MDDLLLPPLAVGLPRAASTKRDIAARGRHKKGVSRSLSLSVSFPLLSALRCGRGSQNTCLRAKGLEAAIQDGWGICVPFRARRLL